MVEEGSSVPLGRLGQRAHSAPAYIQFGDLSCGRLHSDTSFLFRSWISLELLSFALFLLRAEIILFFELPYILGSSYLKLFSKTGRGGACYIKIKKLLSILG